MIVCPRCGGEAERVLSCPSCGGRGNMTWDQFHAYMDGNGDTPRRQPPANRHHEECVAFMELVGLHIHRYPDLWLLHHVGNERRDVGEGRRLKAEGVLPGVSDYCLPVPKGPYAGLYLEMKSPGDNLSQVQREFLHGVCSHGYRGIVAYSAEAAWRAVEEYMQADWDHGFDTEDEPEVYR